MLNTFLVAFVLLVFSLSVSAQHCIHEPLPDNRPAACQANAREHLKGGPVDLRCLSNEDLAAFTQDFRRGLIFTYSELPLDLLRTYSTNLLSQLKVLEFLELQRINQTDWLRQSSDVESLRYLEHRFNFTAGIPAECRFNCAVGPLVTAQNPH